MILSGGAVLRQRPTAGVQGGSSTGSDLRGGRLQGRFVPRPGSIFGHLAPDRNRFRPRHSRKRFGL